MQYTNPILPSFVPGQAVGGAHVFFDDFIGTPDVSKTALANQWLQTDETGTSVLGVQVANTNGGVVEFDTHTTDDSDVSIQLQGTSFVPEFAKTLYFETRLKVEGVALTQAFFGLALTDATPVAGFPADFIGFTMATDADLEIRVLSTAGSDSGDLDTGIDVVADTFIVLAFEWDGIDTVRFFADGAHVKSYSTVADIPTGIGLSPLLGIENNGTTAKKMTIDYVLAMADRS